MTAVKIRSFESRPILSISLLRFSLKAKKTNRSVYRLVRSEKGDFGPVGSLKQGGSGRGFEDVAGLEEEGVVTL